MKHDPIVDQTPAWLVDGPLHGERADVLIQRRELRLHGGQRDSGPGGLYLPLRLICRGVPRSSSMLEESDAEQYDC